MIKRYILLLAVLLATPLALLAQGKVDDGKWKLSLMLNSAAENNLAIIDLTSKDGKKTANVVAVPPQSRLAIKEVKTGKVFAIVFEGDTTFTAGSMADDKSILGTYGNESFAYRARLSPTDKDAIDQSERVTRLETPDAFGKAQQLSMNVNRFRFQAQQEKDPEKKKELQQKFREAQKEADEKVPGYYRELVQKHGNTNAALDAAQFLLNPLNKVKLDSEEAGKLVENVQTKTKPYGPAYSNATQLQVAGFLIKQKGLEALALQVAEPLSKTISTDMPVNTQHQILTGYKAALKANNKDFKSVDASLEKIDVELDRDYLAKVPPFKPAKYAGRNEAEANRVAVLELFTGAQCPPCVAADVAFDALEKAYSHKDLVLIQYHMHIPGPDPLTNADSIARFDYYRKHFAQDMRGTPSTLFNGTPKEAGGGGMANAKDKFEKYSKQINSILEKSTPVKMGGTASRTGDQLAISVDVYGAESEDPLKLRLIVVEETIKYVGSNRLRFHHQVVRDMPGGPDGIAIKDKNFKHQATVDISKLRAELSKYLEEYNAERPFPNDNRPLDLAKLKVIAIVQNDKTAEILQAVQLDVEKKVAAK